MKRLLFLVGILTIAMQAMASPVLTRDLISAGGVSCSAGSIRISGSVGGYALGAGSGSPGILVIEGFWFPCMLSAADVGKEVLTQYPFRLDQSHPNPCRLQTTIGYSVPGNGNGNVPVRIEIFDVQGRRVATLVDASLAPGVYTTQWTGRGATGEIVPAGVYYCSFRTGGTSAIKTLVVLR